MSVIAITGVGGALGRRLVTALDTDPDVARILGVDRWAPQGLSSPKLRFHSGDVREPGFADTLAGAEVVVHLAFQLDQRRDEAAMREVNVDGSIAVFEAALAAGARHVVYTSSVLAYGAHPDNDVPLTESSALRGIPAFPYAEHKRDVEAWLGPWSAAHPELDVTILRLAALVGPGVDNVITRSFEAPRVPTIRGHRPPMQFLHPDDAVRAIQHVVTGRLPGVFNVAADGWLSFDEVIAIVGRGTIEVPEELAYSSVERMWSLGLGDQPPGLLALFMHPAVMSCEALCGTGWRPRHSNRDAVAAMAAERAAFVALGGLRARRATIRRVAATTAGTVAILAWRPWRRFRR